MKPIQLIAVIGGVAIAGVGGWYLYMRSTPTHEKAATRGLDPSLIAPASQVPASVAAPTSAAPTPTAAPETAPAPATMP